jgi:methyltransferase-like protein
LRYLDGQHSRSQIVALLAGEPVRSGELELKLDGVALSDPAIIEKIMAELLDAMLEKIRTRFVLIA